MRLFLASISAVILLASLRLLESEAGDWIWPESILLRALIFLVAWIVIFNRLGRLPAFRDLEAEAARDLVRQELEIRSKNWTGNEYLYVEPPVISPVRVEDVDVSKHGMALTIRMLPRPGFVHSSISDTATVSPGLEDTAITEHSVTQLNIPWTIYPDSSLLPAMTAFAAEQGELLRSNDAGAWRRFAVLARALAEALGDERAEGAGAWYRAAEELRDEGS